MDAIVRGDSDCSRVGKTIILPSSHIGGPRCRAQNYQDAMAICRCDGYPDLFLTFTCNPKWPEINEMQNLISQENDGSHVDIICRVFQIKLFQLMQNLTKQKPFGKIVACKYRVLHILHYIITHSYNAQHQKKSISITSSTHSIIRIYIASINKHPNCLTKQLFT